MRPIVSFLKELWIPVKWIIPGFFVAGFFSLLIWAVLLGVYALVDQYSTSLAAFVAIWSIMLGVVVPLVIFIYCLNLVAHKAHAEMEKVSKKKPATEQVTTLVTE